MKQTSTIKRTAVVNNGTKSRTEIPAVEKTQLKGDILQKIQEKAYELFLKRNGGPGSAEEDWAKAEKIVKGA